MDLNRVQFEARGSVRRGPGRQQLPNVSFRKGLRFPNWTRFRSASEISCVAPDGARAYAHLRNYMDDQHVNGEGRTFSSRHGRLVRAICRGTDGLNPGHRSPLSAACLCQLQYRYEMCVRPRDEPGHDEEKLRPIRLNLPAACCSCSVPAMRRISAA